MERDGMIRDMEALRAAAAERGSIKISVAAANDEAVLDAVMDACRAGIAEAILVGEEGPIRARLEKGCPGKAFTVIDEPDPAAAALKAAALVHDGKADLLLKGLVNTGDFLRAVLDKSVGLRTGRRLSHLVALEAPGRHKLLSSSSPTAA